MRDACTATCLEAPSLAGNLAASTTVTTTTKTHQTSSVEITLGQWQHRIISLAKSRSASNHHSLPFLELCVSWKGAQEMANGLEGTSQGLVAEGAWESALYHPCPGSPRGVRVLALCSKMS